MKTHNLWYKDAVFYQVYIRAFSDSDGDGHGDIPGLTSRLDYIADLGVDCIWIMPMYPSPLKDDGYDISDYFSIHPDYGTLEDFKTFLNEAHKRGLRVITDLVLNHTSDQHPWFQESRKSKDNPYRDYYVWSDTNEKYKGVRIIFLDVEPSNWTLDEQTGQYFWHRFYSSQPDLNYDNPVVRAEMKNVIRYWLDLGVDGYRADAVPYLIEREGTSCENLPETHDYLKEVRKLIDQEYPDRIILCESNMWPEDVRPYFGDGDEFHMGFHFPIMPRIFMALKKGDYRDMKIILDRTPDIPESCQWVTFLRNHDELTLEMVTEADRKWMWEKYAPEPRMRLNLGIRRRLAALLDNDERKIRLINTLLFSLPGSPIVYYGDEIGMGDNIWLDDRNGVRTPMQWTAGKHAGFMPENASSEPYAPVIRSEEFGYTKVNVAAARANEDSIYHFMKDLIRTRKSYPALAAGRLSWIEAGSEAIAAYRRSTGTESIVCLNNLQDQPHPVEMEWQGPLPEVAFGNADDFVLENGQLQLILPPYGFVWLVI